MPVPDEHSPRTVGRYVLYGELASGGMATVHFGRLSGAIGFSRAVAIKRLHPHFAKDPEFVTMFLDEARLCGRIRHPNVVPTLDVVATEGEIFIVMEYVAGEALSKLLKLAATRNLPTPARIVASIMSSVLHGLHAAHHAKDEQGRDLGIVHRDVSPQNIMVGVDGTARVLDFGVAKAAGRLQTTREGQVKGKIAYMPPEQLHGSQVTNQVDVYAASVVMWEALAGRRLFDGETEGVVLARVLDGSVPLPSSLNAELAPAVDTLVLRGLARAPEERFATAREMALAIEQTMGLASPSEVAAWVETVCGDELRRRAQMLADVELAALRSSEMVLAIDIKDDAHSQVSSISVSGPSVVPSPRARGGLRFAISGMAVLAVLAGAFFGFGHVFAPGAAGRASDQPRTVDEPKRSIAIVGPETASAKSSDPAVGSARAPRFGASTSQASNGRRPAANGCDPPFTIDPTTGHKKYKLECLH